MADVRDGVDRMDRALVALITERTRYMQAAARIKPSRDVVRDEARIEDVVSKVLKSAEATGLPATIADPVWRELVEQSLATGRGFERGCGGIWVAPPSDIGIRKDVVGNDSHGIRRVF